ncbi:MAG: four helix bundle protein [Nitrospira sp.]
MEPIKSFEDLDVWKVGRDIRQDLYRLATELPKHEQYCLGQQVRTAAVSITANIAEGYGRFHFKENVQFCRIARGSAYELLDHLIACHDQGYLEGKHYQALRGKLLRFIQLVNGYIRSIGQPSTKKTARSIANDD